MQQQQKIQIKCTYEYKNNSNNKYTCKCKTKIKTKTRRKKKKKTICRLIEINQLPRNTVTVTNDQFNERTNKYKIKILIIQKRIVQYCS